VTAVQRFELLHERRQGDLAGRVAADIARVSPETIVRLHAIAWQNSADANHGERQRGGRAYGHPQQQPQQPQQQQPPHEQPQDQQPRQDQQQAAWDFQDVYGALHDFATTYPFTPDSEDYLVFLPDTASVAQICLCLLTASRHIPARVIQIAPPVAETAPPMPAAEVTARGGVTIIDLELSRHDRLDSRFRREQRERLAVLKAGIDTRNAAFNHLVERIEQVAITSRAPLLLLGPAGSGKSRLARRIFELKRARHQITGAFVELNCATLRGDAAMSALFGHRRGAFTGALQDRAGLLRAADRGVLFLDEVGELGLDEQAMLLRALEQRTFRPLGADREASSDFQLIAGTNRDLAQAARHGRFREDLLARINLWTFQLPALAARPEDLAPNLDYELAAFARTHATPVVFNKDARDRFLTFATSPLAGWPANFRDFHAAIVRMATLAPGGRVTLELVDAEIAHLRRAWARQDDVADSLVTLALGPERSTELDRFDRVQLEDVLRLCRERRTLSDAGRALFSISRTTKRSTNDADRLRKYLARFGLEWQTLRALLDRHV
jgi:transcriptional regulatory protein RtcR